MPRTAPPLEIPPKDRRRLQAWTQSRTIPAGLVQRARIVLMAGQGCANTEIAERAGVSRPTVVLWRNRYAKGGLGALKDKPRPGRPRQIDPLAVVIKTLEPPPQRLGVTHWSSRLLAAEMGISNAAVAGIWQHYDLQPWRSQTFRFPTDPELETAVRDIVGLYLNPSGNAVVVCVDEKTRVQSLNYADPIVPVQAGPPEEATHDFARAAAGLLTALEVATGSVTETGGPPRDADFLCFLEQMAKACPRMKLHVVCDNYATHRHPRVRAWVARNPRITVHVTPTPGSWMTMVEIFSGIITRQGIRPGSSGSARDLTAAIRQFVDGWNERCQPFAWARPVGTLAPAMRKETW